MFLLCLLIKNAHTQTVQRCNMHFSFQFAKYNYLFKIKKNYNKLTCCPGVMSEKKKNGVVIKQFYIEMKNIRSYIGTYDTGPRDASKPESSHRWMNKMQNAFRIFDYYYYYYCSLCDLSMSSSNQSSSLFILHRGVSWRCDRDGGRVAYYNY